MMNQNNEMSAEAIAVKAFCAKLAISRINVARDSKSAKIQHPDKSYPVIGEFCINNLPLLVKKHIITAGVVQGEIFEFGDGFAFIKEVVAEEGSKSLFLVIRALYPKQYEKAIGVVETLTDEVLNPQKKILKRPANPRSWGNKMVQNEFEIGNLIKPVISYVVTKGIIKGEIYQITGSVVSVRGCPYLAGDLPREPGTYRPIYLLIQGPNRQRMGWAVDRVYKLIKEAEQFVNNTTPDTATAIGGGPSIDATSCGRQNEETSGGNSLKPGTSEADVVKETHYPPFMPTLDQTVDGNVQRCVMLVQWLLAHPLLVSFMACPPRGCESKKVSQKLTYLSLMCLPFYKEFKCPHLMSDNYCGDCFKFLSNSQKAVHSCFEAVINEGYNISKLISVDEYIKQISDNPERIGVLYDYPLPLNLFYIDNCRLLIDLIVQCGFNLDENRLSVYLWTTDQWYPAKAFENIVARHEITPCPSRNARTHCYPKYTTDHQGGVVNFRMQTLANSNSGRLFPPDASKIPRCSYFPFLRRLSVFSDLHYYNRMSKNVSEKQHHLTKEQKENCDLNLPSAQEPDSAMQQLTQPGVSAEPLSVPSPSTALGSHLTTQPNSYLGSVVSPNLEQTLGMMQKTMPLVQSTLSVAQSSTVTNWEDKSHPVLKPALLDAGSVVESQPTNYSPSSDDNSEPDPFEDVISKLQEACSSQNPFMANLNLPTAELLTNVNPTNQAGDTPKIANSLHPQMPSSFTVMQNSNKPLPKPPCLNSNPGVNQSRLLRKEVRKQKRKEIAEEKLKNVRAEIDNALEKLKGKNSFWTVATSKDVEKVEGKLNNLLVEETSSNESSLGRNQSQFLLTSSLFPSNLQLGLNKLQAGIPLAQPTLFGAQFSVSQNQENKSWPVWKPPEQTLQISHVKNDDFISTQDSSEQNGFSEAISKLKELIQFSETNTDDKERAQRTITEEEKTRIAPEQSLLQRGSSLHEQTLLQSGSSLGERALPLGGSSLSEQTLPQSSSSSGKQNLPQGVSSLGEQSAVSISTDAEEESSLSAVILKLQQFIDSNKTTSPDESQTQSGASMEVDQNEYETGKGTLKRKSNEPPEGSSSAKHISSMDEKKYHPTIYIPTHRNKVMEHYKKQLSIKGYVKKYINIRTELSILGDSFLQDARIIFGGQNNGDCRKNKYSVKHLTIQVDKCVLERKLKRYCLIMCGMVDLIRGAQDEYFICQYRILVNHLTECGYHLMLVTLPWCVSENESLNKDIPRFNSLILSLQKEPFVSIIPFHEMSKVIEKTKLFKTIHTFTAKSSVLSEMGCNLIKQYIIANRF